MSAAAVNSAIVPEWKTCPVGQYITTAPGGSLQCKAPAANLGSGTLHAQSLYENGIEVGGRQYTVVAVPHASDSSLCAAITMVSGIFGSLALVSAVLGIVAARRLNRARAEYEKARDWFLKRTYE